MITDTELRVRGIRVLLDGLGPVDATRFVSLLLRQPFDYTTWQRQLWADRTVEEISQVAMEQRRQVS